MGRFADDTAVVARGDGRYDARIDRGWWVQRGPNGGYVAAVLLRALSAEVGQPERLPRSLTVHYLRPPAEGPAELEATVEREGRSLSFATARLLQGGDTMAIASAAFGAHRGDSIEFDDAPMPEVAPPEACPELGRPPFEISMRDRYECRLGIGGELFTEGPVARTGGWIRLADGEPADAIVVGALTDAWPPAAFTRIGRAMAVPTIDLTVHWRRPVPDPAGWFLVDFRTTLSAEGYLEEDGAVWSEDGRLLAQSRQLAVAAPVG
jgi:acyl-CoA thioesterase